MTRAMAVRMAAKRYQDLVVWQSADAVRHEVYRLTNTASAAADSRFRDQVRSAASGIGANIVEGFRRFSPRDFARFLDYAYASAGETSHWLDDGVARRYWTEQDVAAARMQLRRLDAGLRALMRYLRSTQGSENGKRGGTTRV